MVVSAWPCTLALVRDTYWRSIGHLSPKPNCDLLSFTLPVTWTHPWPRTTLIKVWMHVLTHDKQHPMLRLSQREHGQRQHH